METEVAVRIRGSFPHLESAERRRTFKNLFMPSISRTIKLGGSTFVAAWNDDTLTSHEPLPPFNLQARVAASQLVKQAASAPELP